MIHALFAQLQPEKRSSNMHKALRLSAHTLCHRKVEGPEWPNRRSLHTTRGCAATAAEANGCISKLCEQQVAGERSHLMLALWTGRSFEETKTASCEKDSGGTNLLKCFGTGREQQAALRSRDLHSSGGSRILCKDSPRNILICNSIWSNIKYSAE